MNTGTISKRYAEALYEYAKELKAESAVYENMLQLKYVLRNLKELPVLLRNPLLTLAEKENIICSAVEKLSPAFTRFVSLVAKNSREDYMLYMAYAYIGIYRADKNIIAAKITTATPLSQTVQEKIKNIMAKREAAEVEIKNVVDETLIGGFICEVDNKRLDASVRKQLEVIEKQLVITNRKIV